MAKGDYKKMVCEHDYFPAFEKLMGKRLTENDKKELAKHTFMQLDRIGLMLAAVKGKSWHDVRRGKDF